MNLYEDKYKSSEEKYQLQLNVHWSSCILSLATCARFHWKKWYSGEATPSISLKTSMAELC